MPKKGAMRKAAEKNKPLPLSKLRFSGDTAFVVERLKTAIGERDQHINNLENKYAGLDRAASRVYVALEEAETLASRYMDMVAEGRADEVKLARRQAEMQRFVRMFREAKDEFQKLRP